jgi:hypothetical protein
VGEKGEAAATGWPATRPRRLHEYLRWLHRSIRVQVKQAYKGGELLTDSEDDIVADEY